MTREEAIHIVKTTHDWAELREALQELVPELAESEDEKIRNALIDFFKKKVEKGFEWVEYGIPNNAVLAYLEKHKEQKTAEWSEEDERMVEIAEECATNKDFVFETLEKQLSFLDWLKSLPERFNLQPRTDWSEKDEDMLNSIISTCQLSAQDRGSGPARHLFEMQERFLKSLRSRLKLSDNWKPSEEQPEVDLEKEIKNYLATKCAGDDEPSVSEIARHFYELGLNARKEE